MPSLIPDSYFDDVSKGNILPASDTIYAMFLTNAATPAKSWAKRSDVTNEVAASGGYVAGGFAVTCSLTLDGTNHREDLSLGGTVVSSATITARYAVYYKHRGGLATADELLFVNDFGADVTSTAANFTLNASTLRIQN